MSNDTREVGKLVEKYPAAISDTGLFFFVAMKERCKWIAQLPEARQNELRAYCRDIESLRRRRQEFRSASNA